MPGRLRRITVYETSTRFYIVGCDSSGTKYNVLKIDRLDTKALVTGEPENDYSKSDIMELLATISEGNSIVYRSSTGKKTNISGGLTERVSNAFGILGVVRFLEGYYLIVITKATIVATFGYHTIYKVAEVAMINIAIDGLTPNSTEEQKYVRLFQSVDLSTDFYFSYTFDLSRSLQENILSSNWDEGGDRKWNADSRFVWNRYLLEPLRNNLVGERWFVEIIHGFVGQQIIELPTSKLSLTLIGRRSAHYAGTRFLKRGANLKGDVANDVETEQIIWDCSSSPHFARGRFSSFVQRRGSVPLRWSQDPATRGVVGKPLILIDIHEPHAQTAASHFRDLRKKYGSPIIVYNLVKRREKRRHEVLLHEQFLKNINYLNQFLPESEHIAYVAFDVARCNKSINGNVLNMLDEISMRAVQQHGWFQTFPMPYRNELCPRNELSEFTPNFSECGRFCLQKGVSRTNCVDCLDRTNVAQFAIGKAAIACQLYSMGVVDQPFLQLGSELCRAYEELFDTHGDTMAWQYAGSQLVHSIKTYKKTAALQERSRDVLQTLSRYYSNTFGDYDKQNAINLFLGMYRPQITSRVPLWDLPTDYYLHFRTGTRITTDYCAWMYDEDELEELMKQYEIVEKPNTDDVVDTKPRSNTRDAYCIVRLSSNDDFREFYRTFELSSLDKKMRQLLIWEQKSISVKGVNEEAPLNLTGFGLWKKESKTDNSKKSSKSKKEKEKERNQLTDDEDDDLIEGDDAQAEEDFLLMEPAFVNNCPASIQSQPKKEKDEHQKERTILMAGLRSRKDAYGITQLRPGEYDMDLYRDYVASGGITLDKEDWSKHKPTLLSEVKLPELSVRTRRLTTLITVDSSLQTELPRVSKSQMEFYKSSINPHHKPNSRDLNMYSAYGVIY